jgi:hypothetical protein
MKTKADHHNLSFSSGARDVLNALYAFEEKDKDVKGQECPPKKKRSPEQKAQTKGALKQAKSEGGGFDNMPQQEVKEAGRKGGESPRKKKVC